MSLCQGQHRRRPLRVAFAAAPSDQPTLHGLTEDEVRRFATWLTPAVPNLSLIPD